MAAIRIRPRAYTVAVSSHQKASGDAAWAAPTTSPHSTGARRSACTGRSMESIVIGRHKHRRQHAPLQTDRRIHRPEPLEGRGSAPRETRTPTGETPHKALNLASRALVASGEVQIVRWTWISRTIWTVRNAVDV